MYPAYVRANSEPAALAIGLAADTSQSGKKALEVVRVRSPELLRLTEQTGEGTRSTAQMVRELSRTAEELNQSVSRFKIA